MYLGRVDKFQCDTCEKIEYANNGLPKRWCWLKTGGTVKHACDQCRKTLPEDQQQFESGQKG